MLEPKTCTLPAAHRIVDETSNEGFCSIADFLARTQKARCGFWFCVTMNLGFFTYILFAVLG